MADADALLDGLLALHARIRDGVLDACARQDAAQLAGVAADGSGDTTYALDKVAVDLLAGGLREIAEREPLVLVAEGIDGEGLVLPSGRPASQCRWRVIMDPIDGTRGLMYQKRSAWVLTGVASNRGAATRLRDVMLAVQTELPLVKQHLSDQLWARRGRGVEARRFNRLTGSHVPLSVRPSSADTLAHGFATVVRFFPGARALLGAVDDALSSDILGPPADGKAASFEDQYTSTGGQLYELMMGHDRFIADLRPLPGRLPTERGTPRPLCCHPYDICTALIAEEAGVVLADAGGAPLDAPLDTTSDVAWVGYANAALRQRVEPALLAALRRHSLLGS